MPRRGGNTTSTEDPNLGLLKPRVTVVGWPGTSRRYRGIAWFCLEFDHGGRREFRAFVHDKPRVTSLRRRRRQPIRSRRSRGSVPRATVVRRIVVAVGRLAVASEPCDRILGPRANLPDRATTDRAMESSDRTGRCRGVRLISHGRHGGILLRPRTAFRFGDGGRGQGLPRGLEVRVRPCHACQEPIAGANGRDALRMGEADGLRHSDRVLGAHDTNLRRMVGERCCRSPEAVSYACPTVKGETGGCFPDERVRVGLRRLREDFQSYP